MGSRVCLCFFIVQRLLQASALLYLHAAVTQPRIAHVAVRRLKSNAPTLMLCLCARISTQFKYTMMAAASFLAEVVKVLERLTTEAADAANQVLEEAMVRGMSR